MACQHQLGDTVPNIWKAVNIRDPFQHFTKESTIKMLIVWTERKLYAAKKPKSTELETNNFWIHIKSWTVADPRGAIASPPFRSKIGNFHKKGQIFWKKYGLLPPKASFSKNHEPPPPITDFWIRHWSWIIPVNSERLTRNQNFIKCQNLGNLFIRKRKNKFYVKLLTRRSF